MNCVGAAECMEVFYKIWTVSLGMNCLECINCLKDIDFWRVWTVKKVLTIWIMWIVCIVEAVMYCLDSMKCP